jgi:general stress protein YciG
MTRKNPHAVALGRKGGRANKGRTSEAKAAAARENGKKGGRPKTNYDPPGIESAAVFPLPSELRQPMTGIDRKR